jgi:CheY-like chemotaxis protein/cytidylate kinase
MPTVTMFSGSYCRAEEVAEGVARELGCPLVGEKLIEEASARSGLSKESLVRAMMGPPPWFNRFSRERERGIACLRLTLAELMKQGDGVCHGFAAHLLPRNISHILRVCLIANLDCRVRTAAQALAVSERKAARIIRNEDRLRYEWVYHLIKKKPWDPLLYDIVVPLHNRSVEEAVRLICENARSKALERTEASRRALDDCLLAARVARELVERGYCFDVTSDDGRILITLKREVFMKARLEEKLRTVAGAVPGVRNVAMRVDASSQWETPFGPLDAEPPIKVLLVDDEKEFVETLSERLRVRELQPAIAHNGEEALAAVAKDEPEVMILDLKMPGIDGMEVLRRIKKERPSVEVIILTGHGSEEDERMARELGAFAYMEKPVDIAILTRVLKEAHAKTQRSREVRENGS